MGTRGFWGIVKDAEEKMIYNHYDSYPLHLGKNVVFAIQNGLENIEKVFDKIILVKNINNLSEEDSSFILGSPEDLAMYDLKEKYFAETARNFFDNDGWLEYGYMIDLDKGVLCLYEMREVIAEIELNNLKIQSVIDAFD